MSQLGSLVGVGVATASAVAVSRHRRSVHATAAARPPVLEKRPHMVPFGAVPGENRGANAMTPVVYIEDPYHYVRDDTRSNPEILEHLRNENHYTEEKTAHLALVRERLYNELLSHVQETDQEVPYPRGPFLYYTRTEEGRSYTIHCRKPKAGDDSAEEILLDVCAIAADREYCDTFNVIPSPDHRVLAYMVDFSGYETYTCYFKDLAIGELLPECIENVSDIVWGKDATEIFYGTQDDAHRQHKVWRRRLGTNEPDECLYTEDDEVFNVDFWQVRSTKFMQFISASAETSEIWVLDLEDPSAGLELLAPRQQGVKYTIDHRDEYVYIVTNKDDATNFKIMRTPVTALGPSHWRDWTPYDPTVKIDQVFCFQDFIAFGGREDGFRRLWIVQHDDVETKTRLAFDEESYAVWCAVNCDYETTKFRFKYSSMTTPITTYDYDVPTKTLQFLKEAPCPHYDRSQYTSERLEATAADGTKVPITLVYRSDLRRLDRPQPLHLYGYGAYEVCMDPTFRTSVLPLLDRGVVYAIAHIRGGGERGRTWYEQAKYATKITTFTDFIACAEHLIATGVTSSTMMSCEGRSAGGLLIGAVLNMCPDLFTAALAGVPFVDVMNTMSDATIPLTAGEWEEWGNPNERVFFEYMLRYSPYDNVTAQAYPSLLVLGGLNDSRVAYWEPTKWVARLRERKTDDNDALLKIDLASGHFSASDRYHYLRETAFELAFLLDHLGCLHDDDKTTTPKTKRPWSVD